MKRAASLLYRAWSRRQHGGWERRVPIDVTDLDNVVWHSLRTRHAHVAETVGRAARYRDDVSVFAGMEAPDDAAWHDLARLVGHDGVAVLFGPREPIAPVGWTMEMSIDATQLVLDDLVAAPVPLLRRLDATDVPQMLELVALTRPGPFLPCTIELGDYYGVFDAGRLVAMAGERMQLPGFTEISAVCTHPDARRRGHAAGLTTRLAAGILDRGDVPFLHHTADNHDAGRVYRELGFVRRIGVTFRSFRAPEISADHL